MGALVGSYVGKKIGKKEIRDIDEGLAALPK
jgi:hypothetical protein